MWHTSGFCLFVCLFVDLRLHQWLHRQLHQIWSSTPIQGLVPQCRQELGCNTPCNKAPQNQKSVA